MAAAPSPLIAAAFPPATNAGIAAAKKGAIPPCCLPTPGLRFRVVPCHRFFMVNEGLMNGTPFISSSKVWTCGLPSRLVKRLQTRKRSSEAGCKSNMKYPKRRVVSLTNNWSTHRYLSGYTCSNKLRMPVLSRALLKQIA